MKRNEKQGALLNNKLRRSSWLTIICDAVLLLLFTLILIIYINKNNENIYAQNIDNVISIGESNSQMLETALNNTSLEVERAYNYCDGKDINDVLDYLSLINVNDDEFQLLKRNENTSTTTYHVYNGYSTKKVDNSFIEVEYKNTSLAQFIYSYSSLEKGIMTFSKSFNNATDGLRYYSVFCGLSLYENGVAQQYYLVKPQKEDLVLDYAQKEFQYQNLSIAICYIDGKYIAYESEFRTNNFFDYLYNYNGLSMDEKNELKAIVAEDEDGNGYFVYDDYKGQECVFVYSSCGGSNDWIVILAVPVSEFVSEDYFSFFPLIFITFLTILLFFNIYRLLLIVKELKFSVEREKIANSSKSSFLSRMSHEIRTPLNAIIGYNMIAQRDIVDCKKDDELKNMSVKVLASLKKSEVASKHLLTIINDVLDMSAIESGKVKIAKDRFDFKNVINSITTIFYSQAQTKGINFEVIFEGLTHEWLIGDQLRTSQILTNLLSNAIKFTSKDGQVILKICQLEEVNNTSRIHFTVSDTGIGMSEEYLSHIWTPFEQADSSISRRFGGTGLGLTITKSLVEIMGGTLNVNSELGKGTTFNVDLIFGSTEQSALNEPYDFSKINALVVDDDVNTCKYIELLFNRCGAKCHTVTSGEEAIKKTIDSIKNNSPYTICLVDWKMPNMDGVETIVKIKEIVGKNIPIIILTAYEYSEIADKAKEIGVYKFISKPLFQSSLFDLLADICQIKNVKPTKAFDKVDFKGSRIILAEDNKMNMEIAKRIISASGIVVESAWNGKEAVDLFEQSEKGTYGAILMDVHMPEMNGYEATKYIRNSNHPDAQSIPIIAMTADAFAENVAEAIASGMNDHISKPIDVNVLFDTLRKYLIK